MNGTKELPLVSIAVISFNRLKYLKATLESLHQCVQYPRIQWIVVDGDSQEAGLQAYLKSLTWVTNLISIKSTHAEAMNAAIDCARGEFLLLWPDDMQFIVQGDWMVDCVDILRHQDIGSIVMNPLRRVTTLKQWNWYERQKDASWKEKIRLMTTYHHKTCYVSAHNYYFRSYGLDQPGIIGSGIPSFTRTDVWRALGRFKSEQYGGLIDSGGGEEEMLRRFATSPLRHLRRVQMALPVAADIVDNPNGAKAKVRNSKRYGIYLTPPDGTFYYKIYPQYEVEHLKRRRFPVYFEEFVRPLGYTLPVDQNGNLLKAPINESIITAI